MNTKIFKFAKWFLISICLSDVNKVYSDETFYSEHEHGWFFYEKVQDYDGEVSQNEPITPIKDNTFKNDNKYDFLSVSWIREYLPKYRDLAIDKPNYENIQAYLYLQRIVLEKSSAFATMFQNVVIGDPNLDAVSQRPIAALGSNLVDQLSEQNRFRLLNEISKKAGILYIIKAKDPFCTQFTPILKRFSDSRNFAVKTVSLDGDSDPTGLMSKVTYDPRAEYVFDVRTVPAVLVFTADGRTETLVQGVVSEDELGKRMLIAAHRLGVISDSEFDESRPLYSLDNQLTKTNLGNVTETNKSVGFIEPAQLIKLIQKGSGDNDQK